MAHFAEIGLNNTVLRVIVVSDNDCLLDGVETESVGAEFCRNLLGGTWVQTSYNGNIRKNYAGAGYTYDAQRNAFIPPQTYPSWILNEQTCLWDAPTPMPTDDKKYQWDEATTTWKEQV
jgi:hypothetical protein